MAKINRKSIFYGMSGKLGDVVFKNRNGETYVSQAAEKSLKPPSEAQLNMRERFGKATAYAKQLKEDAEMKAYYTHYQKKAASAFNAAMRDYQRAPKIGQITVEATDNGKRRLVIFAKDDTAISSFRCLHQDTNLIVKANKAYDMFTIELPEGVNHIKVVVMDRPGNVVVKEIEVGE
ncbi:hypothetical protein AB9P05_06580 [Roseivirga sp. BDSF3-8]|uniref:hypothetical protein n=1 Tax=Roseivirga sp. BDSF3-8 TaxID=3241598 RepID=UPI0035318C9A